MSGKLSTAVPKMMAGLEAGGKASAAAESNRLDYTSIKGGSKFNTTASGQPASFQSRRRYQRNLLGAGMVPQEDIAFNEDAWKRARQKSVKDAMDKASGMDWTVNIQE
jgi:hypothetical protein